MASTSQQRRSSFMMKQYFLLAVKGFHFHNQATIKMTLKRFFFNKKVFFDLKAYFLVPVSLLLAFFCNDCTVSELMKLAIFGSTALNTNLSLNSGTELWLGQIQCINNNNSDIV